LNRADKHAILTINLVIIKDMIASFLDIYHRSGIRLFSIGIFVWLSLFGCKQKQTESLPELVDFNFHVKPILVQKCYLCHGPDPSSRKAGLRLDNLEGATALLKSGGKAIIPGNLNESSLIHRIKEDDPELVMPPPESKTELSAREIAILSKWIKQGAEWKQHWSFIPPQRFENAAIPIDKNGIDYFIEKKVAEKGLTLSPQANKNSLIRRVSYVLTGLPPAVDDLDQFVNDDNSNAYERIVDQYLDSPQFGEKWARHWMDVVRYAETKGHEFDYTITGAWRYRDYLIRAFNDDLPYNQFVKEHLAGDLLKKPRRDLATGKNESQLATMFYALSEGTHSPVDVRQDEADRIDNMIDVTSKAFQGLTVSCARCHDHKFDPIKTKDYYALFGVMESSRFSPIPADLTLEEEMNFGRVLELKSYMRNLVADDWKRLETTTSKSLASLNSEKNNVPSDTASILLGDFTGSTLDGWRSDGMAFANRTTLGEPLTNSQGRWVGLSDGWASSRLIGKRIFGALRSPNFTIDKDFIGLYARGKNSTIRIIIDNFQLISYPIYGGIDKRVDTENEQNFVFDVKLWRGHNAYIEILPGYFTNHVYKLPEDAFVEVQWAAAYNNQWNRPKIKNKLDPWPKDKAIERWRNFSASTEEVNVLNSLIANQTLQINPALIDDNLTEQNQLISHLYDSTFYNGVYDGFAINSPIFVRGSHKDLTENVPRGFIRAIAGKDSVFKSKGSGRTELAESMVNDQNPLTSRVMVNRIWHHLFGRGIVASVDNFGLQGELPTHPELLDFLATKFQAEGWSIKKMIRYILLSETFKRSTQGNALLYEKDPDNLLLSFFPTLRLEAESIRDGLLAVSGRLDKTMYGPPVSIHITDFMQGRGKPKESGPLDGDGRRSIYQEVRRNFLDPMMLTFDTPVPFTAFGKRNLTNVPAQSLILLNHPLVIKQAEVLAAHLLEQPNASLQAKIQLVYKRALSREASEDELKKATVYLDMLGNVYKTEPVDSRLIKIWKDYCHSVFNLKEFIYLI